MTTDADDPEGLYAALGVQPGATQNEIRAAYRAAAKHAHPDAGGSTEEMSKLSTAVAVLSNPRRRKEYHARGSSALPDVAALALQHLVQACNVHMAQAVQRGHSPTMVDIVELMRQQLSEQLRQEENKVAAVHSNAAHMQAVAARLRGVPQLVAALQAQVRQAQQGAVQLHTNVQALQLALRMLQPASFDVEIPQWFTANTASNWEFK